MIEYRADFDREYPVMGTPAYNTIRLKRVDARTAEAVLSHAGRVLEQHAARSPRMADARSRSAKENQGILESNVAIYRKQ